MNQKNKAAIKKQEDVALNHALLWFAVAAVLEVLVLAVDRWYPYPPASSFGVRMMRLVSGALPVCAVLGLLIGALFAWKLVSKIIKCGEIAFAPALMTCFGFGLGISSLAIWRFPFDAVAVLRIAIPVGGVLALLYYLYQKEFFLSAVCSSVSLLGLFLIRNGNWSKCVIIVYTVIALLVVAAVLALAIWMKKTGGLVQWKDKQIVLFANHAKYLPVFLSCALSAASLIAGVLLGSMVAFYLVFVLLAWLFILLVYYTVKLM